jgi:hypothetical protein
MGELATFLLIQGGMIFDPVAGQMKPNPVTERLKLGHP